MLRITPERCRSGLTGTPGERVFRQRGTVGSNPTLSALALKQVCGLFESCKQSLNQEMFKLNIVLPMKVFCVYILRSLRDGTFYYGSTRNLDFRLVEHNAGKVRYTKGHLPYVLHYFETCATQKQASTRERSFKSIDGYNWLRSSRIIG